VASWIKLLVIIHADKIDAKKGNNLFDKASSFDLSIFVF
jgi:hypothetical protein